jgi:transposase
MVELSASIQCITPKRVAVSELLDGPSAVASLPICSAAAVPTGPCPVCPRLAAEFEPWRQAAYWKSMHQRSVAREKLLEEEIARLQSQLRLREQQLFGTKSEASPAPGDALTAPKPTAKKPRGQRRGKPGPQRRDYSHLPVVDEVIELPAQQQLCSCCGLPFEPFAGTEDGQILEIEVKAYRRVYHRRRYRPSCECRINPGIITAPAPEKVIPRCILGVSIFVEILLDKYLFYRPSYRLLADWKTHGLDLSLGTVTADLHLLAPLFEPLYAALGKHNLEHEHWHADETRWLVFASVEGKVGYRWTLWVFHSPEAVVFVLDQGRAHDVPEEHLGPVKEGILSVDRYSAYKAMKQVKEGLILLAFCWAHVRRDFLGVARSWPKEESWALGWVGRIGELYKDNEARLEVLESDPAQFAARDRQLRGHVCEMAQQARRELTNPQLHPARKKVLESLEEHWDGLTIFVDHPEVPMDNNRAERVQRGPVVLRKNSYGSGAVWAGELAAMLFSVFQTLSLWDMNPRVWLTAYLRACAKAGGKAPAALEDFLPWKMSEQKRKEWSLEKEKDRDDSS